MTRDALTNPCRTAPRPSELEFQTVTTIFAFLATIGLASLSWVAGLGIGYLVRGGAR
ncbi:hypothetical protein GOACH_35_00030 [Gordonia aichiensis NBRC 108223]|uniref:Uncharacterized protein n=1 Tax=Gordonia aichiensis NBRC 108223 TaxID=1220583 RepID=L7KR25_9ACTN|nr:hypothetical protein GOACH_35_00030 [Gordonia aichiensis NBRC 108223]